MLARMESESDYVTREEMVILLSGLIGMICRMSPIMVASSSVLRERGLLTPEKFAEYFDAEEDKRWAEQANRALDLLRGSPLEGVWTNLLGLMPKERETH